MTQMLLFDSPTGLATETTVPVASPEIGSSRIGSSEIAERSCDKPVSPRDPGYDRGVNHMGDLARLVLMRYDLVARRRARRAERIAAERAVSQSAV